MDGYQLARDSGGRRDTATLGDNHESARQRPWRKRALSLLSVGFLVVLAIVIVVLVTLHGGSDDSDTGSNSDNNKNDSDSSSNNSDGGNSDSILDGSCASVQPHQRTVAFWQSEVDGCEKVPEGVSHVIFGFALVGDAGTVVPTFQNTDSEIKDCVTKLKAKCIQPMASIGGSTNNAELSAATDVDAFAASAVALIDKFGFSGLDIDDENVGSAFNASLMVARVQATRTALDAIDTNLLLSYDAYFNEGEPSFCEKTEFAAFTRCFPTQLLPLLSWVNIMAYNVDDDAAGAAAIYENALNSTFTEWKTQLGGDFSRATIGICVAASCAYGPGPSAAVIAQWNKYARTVGEGGGMMVYAASTEVNDDFSVTRSVLPSASASR